MRDVTDGSIMKNIFHLAWPTMIAMVLHAGFNIVDTIYIGRLGSDSIAAISIVFPLVMLMFALGNGVGIGATSLIARYVGAKKLKQADNAAEHSYLITFFLSIFFTSFGLLFAKPIFALMGVTPSVAGLAWNYSRWIFGFSIFMFIGMASNSILRGLGSMKIPMIGMVSATIINMILDPLLIFGLLGFPKLGIDGAAIATVFSRLIGMIIVLAFIFSSKTAISIKPRNFKFKKMFIKNIFKVGIPASLNQSLMSISLFVFNVILATFGSIGLATYGIGFRLESVIFLPIIALSTAVITIVGQNVGAKKYDRAEQTVWSSIKITTLIVAFLSILLFIFPKAIFGVFTNEPQLLAEGISFLRIISLNYVFVAVVILISGAFQGAGKAMPALILNTIRLFVIALPLMWFLSFVLKIGLIGIWWSFVISSIVSSIIAVIWFKTGSWKKATLK
ncbi:MAG: MATE family efflux transporter [Candidatus Woesearchaeota archaeon]